MTKWLGIRGKLIIGIVAATAAAIGLMGIVALSILENNVLTAKVRETSDSAGMLRSAFSESYLMYGVADPYSSVAYARNMFRHGRAEAMVLNDASGAPIFSEGELPEKKGKLIVSEDGIRIYSDEEGWFAGPGRYFYVEVDEGKVRVSGISAAYTVPLADIAADISKLRSFVIFYAMVDSVVIIVLGVYFLSVFVVTPVKRLETAASSIASGELSARAPVGGDDEIGRLAEAFNTMTGRLEDEIKRLEVANAELVKTREELLRASTLAAVGGLAAGIAHEIGNPLSAVSGYLEILGKGIVDKDEERDIIARTAAEIERINKIVREFLDIARPSSLPPTVVDVNAAVKDSVEVLRHGKEFTGVEVNLDLQSALPPVIINEDKLRQVFINLLLNAACAAKAGGIVFVRTFEVHRSKAVTVSMRRRSDPPQMEFGREDTDFIAVEFADNGAGIKKEDMARIFEPFFTTKPVGQGTGLGLFVSQGIIKTYGGAIEAESDPEAAPGAVFRVLLPADKP